MRDKLDKRTKWSYCVGATGRDAAYALVSMYLILYVQYTMHLTSAQFAVISGVMIVCMVWDAINDLLMGIAFFGRCHLIEVFCIPSVHRLASHGISGTHIRSQQ